MKAKLIKTDVNYLLRDEEDVIIASTSFKTAGISLSKQNCDDIFGVIDVEKIADIHTFGQRNHEWKAYVEGFNKAMELMKDKLTWFKQPTEIEVEIEMEDLMTFASMPKEGENRVYEQPKLDSSGCLILKRVVC
jgi:hypothetical protein